MSQFRPSRFQILPLIIKNLIIINGLFYLATITLNIPSIGIDLTRLLGLHYFQSEDFRPHQYVSYLFIHSPDNVLHIFLNMFALWMFGAVLENVWGPRRFLVYYFVTGIGAALVQTAVNYFQITLIAQHLTDEQISRVLAEGNSLLEKGLNYSDEAMGEFNLLINTATVGASGAVFGVLLAFGMLFPNTYLFIYFLFPIKAKYFVILYALFELWAGFRNTDNIAHFAHLGGMIFGYFLIRHWNRTRRRDFF